jgi:hypothetical protein
MQNMRPICDIKVTMSKVNWIKLWSLIIKQSKVIEITWIIFKISEKFNRKQIKNNNGAQSLIK